MICWGGCVFWMWEGALGSEMISPSTRDASTATVEEVVAWGASTSSVEAGTGLSDDVERISGSSSSSPTSYNPSSIKILSSISLSHAHSKTSWGQGLVSSKVTSHDSTTVLVSRLSSKMPSKERDSNLSRFSHFKIKHLHPKGLRWETEGLRPKRSSKGVKCRIERRKIRFEIYQAVLIASAQKCLGVLCSLSIALTSLN
jgi:hypothetical protein